MSLGELVVAGKIHELRYQAVTYALMQVALGYVQLISSVVMVCLTMLRWNMGERDALICKLLRGKLQELEQSAAPNSRPSSQFQSSPEVQSSQ